MNPVASLFAGGRRRWLIAAAGGLLLVTALGVWSQRGRIASVLARRQHARAERFVATALDAWRNGDLRAAEVNFLTADQIEPAADGRMMLGRLYLQRGDRPRARETMRAALAAAGRSRPRLAVVYRDSLVGAAWWDELAGFSLEQLFTHPADSFWLGSALDGIRLARWNRRKFEAALPPTIDRVDRALLLARVELNDNRPAAARAQLASIDVALRPERAWLCARLWRQAGDTPAAATALARTDRALDHSQRLLTTLFLAAPAEQPRVVRILAQAAGEPGFEAALLRPALNLLWDAPNPEAVRLLAAAALPARARLAASTVAALWLQACANRDVDVAAPWRDELARRLGFTPSSAAFTGWNTRSFALAANSLPLTRDTLDALLAVVPVPATPVTTHARVGMGRGLRTPPAACATARGVGAPRPQLWLISRGGLSGEIAPSLYGQSLTTSATRPSLLSPYT